MPARPQPAAEIASGMAGFQRSLSETWIRYLEVETTIIDGEIIYRRSPTLASQRVR